MTMSRREVLKAGAAVAAATALPGAAWAQGAFAPKPGAWRSFQTVTRLEIGKAAGQVQAWVPLPAFSAPDWFRPDGSTWTTNAKVAEIKRDAKYGAEFLYAAWSDDEKAPVVELTSRFATRDRAVDLPQPRSVANPSPRPTRAFYTAATDLKPIDGIVLGTARQIIAGKRTRRRESARIYDWIVDNTERNPKTRGCGVGDIKAMLETRQSRRQVRRPERALRRPGALGRAAGARRLRRARGEERVRLSQPRRGHRDITRAQHCRAEVWLAGFGWVPVDPADVRKVVLEERPQPRLADPLVPAVRASCSAPGR